MQLTRYQTTTGPRWACDGHFLPAGLTLATLLTFPRSALVALLAAMPAGEAATGDLLTPVEAAHEVWGCGVTYLRSRDARKAESAVADVYQRVYEAERPELFFKSAGWRAVGNGQPVRIRQDATWNVPEPELTLVINAHREIVGFTVGNDMSSRDIEGENPLYLPQAKTYNGSCAVGPAIQLVLEADLVDLPITLEIRREGNPIFVGDTSTGKMKRTFADLAAYLCRELDFPHGVFLMTGTGIVPGESFTLKAGDSIRVKIAELKLENTVA